MKTSLLRFPLLLCLAFMSSLVWAQKNSPCTLNRLNDTTVRAEKGKKGATVNLPDPNQNNGCGKITYTPASGTTFPIGITKVMAKSANGNVSKEFTVTVLDVEPPVITCPEAIFTNTDLGVCAATITNVGTPTVSDNDGVTITGTRSDNQPLSAPYPKGTTLISWVAKDAAGNEATCTQTIVVSDKEAPVMVTPFTGNSLSKNTDPDVCSYTVKGTELDVRATDNCAGAVTITYAWSGASEGSANTLAGVVFEKGTTAVVCSAADANGNAAEWWFDITVVDNQPPVITSVTATPDVLWSPNHKMVDVTLNYVVKENCSGITYQVVSITSNEPANGLGDGNTEEDWNMGTDGQHVQVRSERSGTGTDRIYTIVVKVQDASGNESEEKTVTVTVPHDQGRKTTTEKALDVTVAPNPSSHSFTFKAASVNTKDKITMVVSDNLGRPVFQKTGIAPGQTITMGSDLQPGTYYVEFQQGNETTQRQIIKVQ